MTNTVTVCETLDTVCLGDLRMGQIGTMKNGDVVMGFGVHGVIAISLVDGGYFDEEDCDERVEVLKPGSGVHLTVD